MRKQVEIWQTSELLNITAKLAIYEVFVVGQLELRSPSPYDCGSAGTTSKRLGTARLRKSELLSCSVGADFRLHRLGMRAYN